MKNSDNGTIPAKSKTYRGQSTEERIAERRKRLVEAGIELYGTQGFRATSVKMVCLAAGLTERYFYESFANGEALLCEACTTIMDGMRQQAIEAMAQVGDSVSERVHAATNSYFANILEHPALGRVILFEMEGVSTPVDAHYAKEMAKSTRLFVEWFFSRVQARATDGLDTYVLAQAVIGALYQVAKEWMRSDFSMPAEVAARHMQAVTLGICGAPQLPSRLR